MSKYSKSDVALGQPTAQLRRPAHFEFLSLSEKESFIQVFVNWVDALKSAIRGCRMLAGIFKKALTFKPGNGVPL